MNKMIAKRYMIVNQIGQGGMADVYVAVDTLLNREVAIKVLRGELSNDPVALLRFQREANASTALTHPNIVEIYDVGEENGQHFIVMEYIRGKDLKQLISQRGALYKEEAVDIMKQLVSAVAQAHQANIIHRDIKPQNVLVKDDGTLKVVDFGIALAQDALQLTQSDSVMGSVHYLAPELARGEAATSQSDIYSLGIVFYELLTGEVPYRADAAVQVALKHMREEIPSVCKINPSLPQSIENIIIRATAKNKANRYHNCQEMMEDLKTCLLPTHAHDQKVVFKTSQEGNKTIAIDQIRKAEPPKKKKRKLNVLGLVFTVGIVLTALTGIILVLALSGNTKGRSTTVPTLENLTLEQGISALEDAGLEINRSEISYDLTDTIEKDKIFATDPIAGSEIQQGSQVKVKVSLGIYLVIDNYIGKNVNEVRETLKQYANLRVIVSEEANDGSTPGTILRQELLEPGSKVNPKLSADIRFVIAAYPSFVIPDLTNYDINEAKTLLEEKGATVILSVLSTEGMNEDQINALATGVVVRMSPSFGVYYTQDESSAITLYYY